MNSCDSESLPEESRGDNQSLTSQSSRNSNKSRNRTTLQSSKVGNAYHIVLQSSESRENTSTTTHVRPKTTPTEPADNPRHTLVEMKKLTEHRSNHVRPESHDTSTNIPDLHEVGKEQPGVTTGDTKQPCEKQRLTTSTATSDLHKGEGPQVEPTCTSDTPLGQGTTPTSATTNGTKERVIETTVRCQHLTP
ncbi:hypothetical protein Taro_054197 [Colocasia esculenta]|uniref:Uncharacterized protein n=1 Tax=Colocasia esculenta TaxID=4460 RepID=A0A843XPS2_COLES|nr:hypothetical protein [Colocasia esculenta]